jgi:hypothetical protein
MRSAAWCAGGVLALVVGHLLPWSSPVAAQTYKAPQSTEAADKPANAQPGPQAPRRRPASPDERRPATDPANSDQCAWIGQRIISLLIRDDAMAAGDFSPFYVKFGCSEEHLGLAFGCLAANLVPAENGALADQAEECWRDPAVRYVPVNQGKTAAEANRQKGEPKGEPAAPSEAAPPRSN